MCNAFILIFFQPVRNRLKLIFLLFFLTCCTADRLILADPQVADLDLECNKDTSWSFPGTSCEKPSLPYSPILLSLMMTTDNVNSRVTSLLTAAASVCTLAAAPVLLFTLVHVALHFPYFDSHANSSDEKRTN